MNVEKTLTFPVKIGEDVVRLRQVVRAEAIAIGLSLVDQTKVITAASEIARNTIDYGKGGDVTIEVVNTSGRRGVKVVFADNGPGIVDMEKALTDGYTTGGGLGLGLSGAKRLVNEFDVKSTVGHGTVVTLIRWKA